MHTTLGKKQRILAPCAAAMTVVYPTTTERPPPLQSTPLQIPRWGEKAKRIPHRGSLCFHRFAIHARVLKQQGHAHIKATARLYNGPPAMEALFGFPERLRNLRSDESMRPPAMPTFRESIYATNGKDNLRSKAANNGSVYRVEVFYGFLLRVLPPHVVSKTR